MEKIVEQIKEEVLNEIEIYKNNSEDNYDFWNEHIKYVYEESTSLAEKYGADIEIVSIGALLHDIALIKKVGDRKEHHSNGAIITREILSKYNIEEDIKERIVKCVYNHRSSKNATSLEELCVCDADILAHFDNIPMLFNSAYNRYGVSLNEVRKWMSDCFEKDYNDLSDRTKEEFKNKYNIIKEIVIGK